ncbi:MAG TPA: SCO family protein [Mycobacteriales bacterium]|jgi:protein SCO1/2|nr:SCO family protein [Mycobacteriales bacterium]
MRIQMPGVPAGSPADPLRRRVIPVLIGMVLALAGCATGSHGPAAAAPASPAPASPVAAAPSTGPAPVSGPGTLHGIGIAPPPRKPQFVLTDTAGRPFDLTKQTAGRLTYLYFGYTNCPDACPSTMANISIALSSSPANLRSRVAVVFVTTDPQRDTPAALRTWLDRYNPSFIGLTGTPQQIAAAEQAAQVPIAKAEPGNGNYGVNHSAEVFAFSPDGISHVIYTDGFHPSDYAHDLPLLLART